MCTSCRWVNDRPLAIRQDGLLISKEWKLSLFVSSYILSHCPLWLSPAALAYTPHSLAAHCQQLNLINYSRNPDARCEFRNTLLQFILRTSVSKFIRSRELPKQKLGERFVMESLSFGNEEMFWKSKCLWSL